MQYSNNRNFDLSYRKTIVLKIFFFFFDMTVFKSYITKLNFRTFVIHKECEHTKSCIYRTDTIYFYRLKQFMSPNPKPKNTLRYPCTRGPLASNPRFPNRLTKKKKNDLNEFNWVIRFYWFIKKNKTDSYNFGDSVTC